MLKVLDYILGLVTGEDGRLGIKKVLAIFTFIGLVRYMEKAEKPDPSIMYAFITLIALLLALTIGQNAVNLIKGGQNSQQQQAGGTQASNPQA